MGILRVLVFLFCFLILAEVFLVFVVAVGIPIFVSLGFLGCVPVFAVRVGNKNTVLTVSAGRVV